MSISSSFAAAVAAALCALPLLAQSTAPDFARDIQPVLKSACLPCHGDTAQGGLRLDSAEAIARGGKSGSAVIPANPAGSPLIQRLSASDRTLRMPPGGTLPAEQLSLLRAWIERGAAGLPSATTPVDFTRDIQPILSANCYRCHSGAQPKGQLRLDSKVLALNGGMSGAVIQPGHSQSSRLVHRVLGEGGEARMPFGGKPLTPDQIATLKSWIDQGATWPDDGKDATIEKHWAYVKPVRAPLPAVTKRDWIVNPIDAFVLARLEKEGLQPSPEASRETLIRRVSLDLIGLPPTPAEVDAFLSDSRPGAYDRLIDRLLASPHYGERWARPWLDLARYADTNGYEKDRRRSIWKFRDWVIGALNKDMPFDEFTIEQIAGDMLPNATEDQKIATGFHRNTQFNEEGGVDKDEAQYEVLVDRVNTTGTVWLGSSIGCSQCHNHKFDPFTQKEYYQLMAFLNNGAMMEKSYGDTSKKWIEPELDMPTQSQARRRDELKQEIDAIEKKLKTGTPQLDAEQAEWEQRLKAAEGQWTALAGATAKSSNGTTLTLQPDGSWLASGTNPDRDVYMVEAPAPNAKVTALRLEVLPDPSLPRQGPGRDAYGNFFLTEVTIEQVSKKGGAAEKLAVRTVKADGGRVPDRSKEKDAHLWIVDATRDDVRRPRQLVLKLDAPLRPRKGSALRVTLNQASDFPGQGIGRFRLSVSQDPEPEFITQIGATVRPLLAKAVAERSAEERKQIAEAYRLAAPSFKQDRERLTALRKELDALGIVNTLIFAERDSSETPSAKIRLRGSFLSPGETVYAGVPASLHPLPKDAPLNRLTLARWLVSRENPLTARVTVNRIWEQYFGRGIVETAEDFGSQGHRPSHPALLDWLAVEFMEKGWSQKAIHRAIVTSATYRQDSRVSPSLRERDPDNRLFARGPRFRMEAEMVRDVTLSAGGLLSAKIGGPSVFPYQPEGVWDIPYSDDKWEISKGEDRYRRGLYTFIRRTSPYPSLLVFDAPSREVCTARRPRTNTPLQSLTTLNDRGFFEAAQALARRVLAEAGPAAPDRAAYAFRICTSRKPKPEELARIVSAYEVDLKRFRERPEYAMQTAGVGDRSAAPERAAWTMVANILLNLDETLTKE